METAYPLQSGFGASGFGMRVLEQHGDGVYGEELPLFVDAEGTHWIGGRSGQKYAIDLIVPSDSRKRYLSICAVDGRNIFSGDVSAGSSSEGGYVVSPPMSQHANVVPGWNTSHGTAAAFVFTDAALSYSSRMGSDPFATCGIIGLRFFSEKVAEVFAFASVPMAAVPYNCRSASPVEKGMGTGYGQDVAFVTRETEFIPDRSATPLTFVYRYADIASLVQRGYRRLTRPKQSRPQPFPAATGGCPVPPGGWRS